MCHSNVFPCVGKPAGKQTVVAACASEGTSSLLPAFVLKYFLLLYSSGEKLEN